MKARTKPPTLSQIIKLYGMVFRKNEPFELCRIAPNGKATHKAIEGENKPETLPAFDSKNKSRKATRFAFDDNKKPL